jgi:hypothetical protein
VNFKVFGCQNQDAVGFIMADMLHAVTILAVVEALILNFPAALARR